MNEKYDIWDDVSVELSDGEFKEAHICKVLENDKYIVAIENSSLKATVSKSQLRRIIPTGHKFFGG